MIGPSTFSQPGQSPPRRVNDSTRKHRLPNSLECGTVDRVVGKEKPHMAELESQQTAAEFLGNPAPHGDANEIGAL